jgi:hypothetical protein
MNLIDCIYAISKLGTEWGVRNLWPTTAGDAVAMIWKPASLASWMA